MCWAARIDRNQENTVTSWFYQLMVLLAPGFISSCNTCSSKMAERLDEKIDEFTDPDLTSGNIVQQYPKQPAGQNRGICPVCTPTAKRSVRRRQQKPVGFSSCSSTYSGELLQSVLWGRLADPGLGQLRVGYIQPIDIYYTPTLSLNQWESPLITMAL